uniref:Uncharacterized protein n=1 Tax=Oryza barthii TaxID=65489 RepID=A0A0D3F5Y0_9ORYZ
MVRGGRQARSGGGRASGDGRRRRAREETITSAGQAAFRSQPIPGGKPARRATSNRGGRMMSRDRRYDSFKTWSGKLERQLAHLAGAGPEFPEEEEDGCDAISSHHTKSMPQVDRFFAALECPELDKLRSPEELVLPLDKTWPFLLRFPVSAFGICLGVSTQAILWKTVATSAPTRFLHVTTKVNLVLVRFRRAHVRHRSHLRLQGGLLLRGRP